MQFEIIDYFEKDDHIQAAENFRLRLVQKISFISKYPEAGRPTTQRANLRYTLIDKHRRLYYSFTSEMLTLLAFFDARQNPAKAPY